MHQVVQKHLPVGQKARSIENRLALKAEFPVLRPGLIGHVFQRGANLGCALVEDLYQLLRGLKGQRAERVPLEKSSSGVVRMVTPNPASSATCGASLFSGIDLGCGVKSFLSSGTRSSMVRVVFASASNSRSQKIADGHAFLRIEDRTTILCGRGFENLLALAYNFCSSNFSCSSAPRYSVSGEPDTKPGA